MKATYIDHMGSDLAVVNAARVSFSKESEWDWVEGYGKSLYDRDAKLIKYLADHNHWTPFSHVMITMREKVPIFVARQRFKHMVGFTYNEVSRRYVNDAPEFYEPSVWRGAPTGGAKQGSSEEEVKLTSATKGHLKFFWEDVQRLYNTLLEEGVAPEQARMVLPQSMYTEYYVTGSLAAWARAYKLRIDPHAQKEIQDLAKQWNEIIFNIPELEHSWNALTN